jgi:hypothetical protein
MSLLIEAPPALYPATHHSDVVGLRYIDPAVRLHSWSIPTPRCIHDVQLGDCCDACDADLSDE